MRLILLFLILTSCYEINVYNEIKCSMIRSSDAQPIQFWPVGELTFNERGACNMKEECYCQLFNCDDDIQLKFIDEVGGNYEAEIVSESIILSSIIDIDPDELGIVQTKWENLSYMGGGESFLLSAYPYVDGNGSQVTLSSNTTSRYILKSTPIDIPSGSRHNITLNYATTIISGAKNYTIYAVYLDSLNNEVGSDSFTISAVLGILTPLSHTFSLLATSNAVKLAFRVSVSTYSIGSFSIRLNDLDPPKQAYSILQRPTLPFIKSGSNYSADLGTFLRNLDPPICDEEISININIPSQDGEVFDLMDGNQTGTGQTWTLGASPSVTVIGSGSARTSKMWYIPFTSSGGLEYTIHYNADFDDPTCNMSIYFLDGSFNQMNVVDVPEANVSGGIKSGTVIINPSGAGVYLGIQITAGGLTHNFVLNSLSVDPVVGGTVLRSGCVRLSSITDCSVLIGYTNPIPYADLDCDGDTLYARVEGRFSKKNFPDESEIEDMSNGNLVELTSMVKTQKLLELKAMPDYMHHKLKLILNHKTVTIGGSTWKQEDSYNVNELHRNFPLKTGDVYLTEQGSIVRNVYPI